MRWLNGFVLLLVLLSGCKEENWHRAHPHLRWRRLICTVKTPASTAGKGRGLPQFLVSKLWRLSG
jgi:hypothetical protein